MAENNSTCCACKLVKVAAEFNRAAHHKNGLSSRCRACDKTYSKIYRSRPQLRKSFAQRAAEKAIAQDKLCHKCKTRKPKQEFGKCSQKKDGLRPWCKDCHNADTRKWRKRNPDRQLALGAAWIIANPEKRKATGQRAYAKRAATAEGKINYRISCRMRSGLSGKRSVSTVAALGFTSAELHVHLEKQFTDGMDWPAFMRGEIHIDHIRPLASFSFKTTNCPEFKQAWALSNLRPLWAIDNHRKKDKRIFLI